MIFWIILIIIQLVNTALLVRFGKGNNFVRVEHKHCYTPVDKSYKHGGKHNA